MLARRHGRVEAVLEPTPGWTGSVYTLNGRTRFSIDDEGGEALLCAADAALLASLRADYARLNASAAELHRAMAEAPALELECLEADGGLPSLAGLAPPPVPTPEMVAAVEQETERLKRALAKHSAWCFPAGDNQGMKGMLELLPDGRALHTRAAGQKPDEGRWSWPRQGSDDSRIEVVVGTVLHYDVGASGHLGHNYVDAKGAQVREELQPGRDCWTASAPARGSAEPENRQK